MKKIYLFFLILLFAGSNAQIVNIPDANFKAKLVSANTSTNPIAFNSANQPMVIDANADGEIQISEAIAVSRISFNGNSMPINSVEGIRSFTNLTHLSLYTLNITTLDVSDLPLLSSLHLSGLSQLTSFNIDNCTSLLSFNVQYCDALSDINLISPTITHLTLISNNNLSGISLIMSNLEWFILRNSGVGNLNLSNLNALTNVEIKSNPLMTGINFQNSNAIQVAKLENNNNLASLDFSGHTNLGLLDVLNHANLSQVNIAGCSGLGTLKIKNSPNLLSLPLAAHPQLNVIDIQTTGITSLDLMALPSLGNFKIYNSPITLLDLSQNPNLWQVVCENTAVQNIIIKNGASNFPTFYYSNNSQLHYICADPEDVNAVINSSGYNSSIAVNSYCSFVPGGTYYTTQGATKYDHDTNGCTGSDPFTPLQKFNFTSGTVSGSITANNSGNYTISVQAGTHTITPVLENPTYFTISPASISANFPTQISPLTQNFCITANGNHNDLESVIIPITDAVPGFTSKYRIIYKNKGTAAQSGSLVFSYDDNLMNFTTATVAPASQSTGTLNWNFTNLLPFEAREVTVTFTLNTPTATPPLTGGHILNYTAQVTGATDETPADNNFTLNQTVVNSFDPNDKTCLQGTAIAQAQVGDYVHYLIRFENTGTANAQNVVVKDIIDTSKFNLSSLVAVGGSHSFVTRITGPNTVEFIFENIQLPFADATNDGYVVFKIKTLATLTVGNAFSNTANIYFDYNAPIVTNTYTTTVQSNLSTAETVTEEFSIYPNPVKDVLHFKTKERIVKAEVYDLSGRIVRSSGITQNAINLSELPKGNYLIRIYTKDQVIIKKLIKD
ncbi:T9SS type A sorting domain-containing protein [Marnyiella aurantia]|uniref:T9SS type A sorting domain-containing protein n=1 Tax=Marnyiella aurantia TaxID=2758037 RepID=A0A7D7QRU1_9FLAO|nr:T9SS type A sorting domain-containing protein [Marnyiella aurantia]MBA5246617.1 T9SS type A sorting domain-containing protein [Marnyiella aurantia]QMS98028.1 T9SS type A sorting domain-containing protein [Marnyiella aurantia]